MIQGKDLIIFDIDGTLFDSVDFNTENINGALAHFGFEHVVEKRVVRENLGCTAEEYYKNILDEVSYKEWRSLRRFAREKTPEMIKRFGKSFDGVYETFKKLHEKDIQIVLYSNCSRLYLEAAVALIGIGPFLSYTECVKDNGIPKPALIKKILEMYPERDAVVVGDRIHDYEAAEANNIPCIAAMYGFGESEMKDVPLKIWHIGELVESIE